MKTAFYQNKGQVTILKETKKMAFVRSQGMQKIDFWVRKTSLNYE